MNTHVNGEPTTVTAVSRVRARNSVINAFLATRLDEALAQEHVRGPLQGVPYGLKDEWETAGMPTTGGSHRHRHRISRKSSAVHVALERAGAVLIGKTNLSDMGLAPEASSFVGGPTRNPHDLTRTAGGSSGGAAAAVADGMIAFDWGTDIGGSIRMPAAFCGVYGLRLSSETWPLADLFPAPPASLAWMCGQGPLARSTRRLRSVLDVLAPTLRTGVERPFSPKSIVLQVPDRPGEWASFAVDVSARVARLGLPIEARSRLPRTTEALHAYSSVWSSHFEDLLEVDPTIDLREGLAAVLSSVLLRGRLGDRRFHPATAELLGLIALGRVTLFRDRRRALRAATAVRDAFRNAWDRGQLVVAPVCVYPAPRIGRLNYNTNILSCTVSGNLADATGLAIPFGHFRSGMPRAFQLLGPPGSERVLLDLADRVG